MPIYNYTPLSQTTRNWRVMWPGLNNDVYAAVDVQGLIYKRTAGVGDFVSVSPIQGYWWGGCVDPTNGDVYAANYADGWVYKQTGGVGSFLQVWFQQNLSGMCAAPNGDIYVCAYEYTGLTVHDIYIKPFGSSTFTALNQSQANWNSMCSMPDGTVYAGGASGQLYKRVGGVGNFILDTATIASIYLRAIWSDPTNGDIYACNYVGATGGVWRRPSGQASFTNLNQASRVYTSGCTSTTGVGYVSVGGGDIYQQQITGAYWTSQRSGSFSRTSDNTDSPWYDGGTQTARASAPTGLGDAPTIALGHNVTQDAVVSGDLSSIDIYGKLSAATNASSKLQLGSGAVTVYSGGELELGTAVSPILYQYTCDLLWNTTGTDNYLCLSILSGGRFTTAGDPNLYGADYKTALQADWTSGQTFTVVGNYSSKWQSGQTVILHRHNGYSSYNTDIVLVTLNGAPSNASNSICTINEAFPTGIFNAGGRVVNVSRNIRIGKVGASTVIGNQNSVRPQLSFVSGSTIDIRDAIFTGLYYTIDRSLGANYQNCVWRNSLWSIYTDSYSTLAPTITDCVAYSVNNGPYGYIGANIVRGLFFGVSSNAIAVLYSSTIQGAESFSNNLGISSIYNSELTLDLYENKNGASTLIGCNFYGNIYANGANDGITGGFASGYTDVRIHGRIGYDPAGTYRPNYIDFRVNGTFYAALVLGSATLPASPVVLRNVEISPGRRGWDGVYCEDYQGIKDAVYCFLQYGDIIRNTPIVRTGGGVCSLEVIPLSKCSLVAPLPIFEWTEFLYATGAYNRSVYIKGEGWGTFPTSDQMYIEAEYYNSSSVLTKAVVKSTQVLSDNTNWGALTVSFNQLQIGSVKYRAYLKTYGSACKVYVDCKLVGSMTKVVFRDGQSNLESILGELSLNDVIQAAGGKFKVPPVNKVAKNYTYGVVA